MHRAVILTALSVEYLAVRHHLACLQEEIHPQGTIYERGEFAANGQTWEVGIVEIGAGNAGAAVEAERAIAYFKPDILFFVGIAGGIKDVAIGDVVAATDVYTYESGKEDAQRFLTRPKAGKSAYALVQRAKSEARKGEWLKRLANSPTLQPRVFVAPIVAGEKVVASRESDVFKLIKASYSDVIAIEMEGYGFLSAAFAYPKIKSIVIRGISDLVEGKNDDSEEPEEIRQENASHHASAFAFELLAKSTVDQENEQKSMQKTNISSTSDHLNQFLSKAEIMQDNSTYQYDVFISYSSIDRLLVNEFLIQLEKLKIKACIDYRDFTPGMPSIKNIEYAIVNSHKTILFLTPNYIQSQWTEFENIILQTLDPSNQKLRLIPILKQKCELPLRLSALTYLNFTDPENEVFEWQRLIKSLTINP
jgi:nucleoside phosphorylase